MNQTNTKDSFIKYIFNKTNILVSYDSVDKLLNSINKESLYIYTCYFEKQFTIKNISKELHRTIDYVNDVLYILIYIVKFIDNKSKQDITKYIINSGISLISNIDKLNLSNSQINILHKQDIFTIQQLVNYIEEGNRLKSVKGITNYVEKRIVKSISIFLSIKSILRINYGIIGSSKILSILTNNN